RQNTRSAHRHRSPDEDRLQRALFRSRFCTSCFRRLVPRPSASPMPSQDVRDTALSAALAMILTRRVSLFSLSRGPERISKTKSADAHGAPWLFASPFTRERVG